MRESGLLSDSANNNHVSFDPMEGDTANFLNGRYTAFCYVEEGSTEQRFWQVPRDFTFPKVTRKVGWAFWIKGMPDYCDQLAGSALRSHPILPFRHFDPKKLPKKARFAFLVNWKPVFSIMDEAIVSGDSPPNDISLDKLEKWYADGTALLRMRASYAFAKERHGRWGVGTWSKAVLPSQISKYGTETDKLALPPLPNSLSLRNRQQRTSKGRKRALKVVTRHVQCRKSDAPELAAAEPPPESLTEAEQQQLISTSREPTLEAAVSKYLRHMNARIQEEGQGNVQPTEMEALAMIYRATQRN